MTPRIQKGIISPTTNPKSDAAVIVLCVFLGYCKQIAESGRPLVFFSDNPIFTGQPVAADNLASKTSELNELKDFMASLGSILSSSMDRAKLVLLPMPEYDLKSGKSLIHAGTGQLDPSDMMRYAPVDIKNDWTKKLYDAAIGKLTDSKGNPIIAGYEKRGAYTGFVTDRQDGQTGLFSTFRLNAGEHVERWLPSDPELKDKKAIWGMIAKPKEEAESGMYLGDQDVLRNKDNSQPADVLGYVHGMVQAIYDVRWRKAGNAHEIAVGKETTKLASCLHCALFMEANNLAASAIHLDRGESWTVEHLPSNIQNPQADSKRECNNKWSASIASWMRSGIIVLDASKKQMNADSIKSFAALKSLSVVKDNLGLSSLLLDASTIHEKEFVRMMSVFKM
jgi:hypothetical protein